MGRNVPLIPSIWINFTSRRALQYRHQSHTAKSANNASCCLTAWILRSTVYTYTIHTVLWCDQELSHIRYKAIIGQWNIGDKWEWTWPSIKVGRKIEKKINGNLVLIYGFVTVCTVDTVSESVHLQIGLRGEMSWWIHVYGMHMQYLCRWWWFKL